MRGIAASPGIAIGKAFLLEKSEVVIDSSPISEGKIQDEIIRFNDAKLKTKSQLLDIEQKTLETMGESEAKIFKAHIMVLEDPTLQMQVEENIIKKTLNAEAALDNAIKDISAMFANIDDEYIKERLVDIKDVGTRILYNLAGIENIALNNLKEEVIIISKDLTPSDTAQMDLEKVRGFVTDMGGRTSHTAIMARSLEIPAVVGTKNATSAIKGSEIVIVDGIDGLVIVNPTENEIKVFEEKRQKYLQEVKNLEEMIDLPAVTVDHKRVELAANIGTPKDIDNALKNGAEGIGLYRTEFLYMDRNSLPSEDEQFEAYKEVALKMGNRPVTIRTLDIGGDKELPYIDFPKELNPFLGWRAIRMCLDKSDIFRMQLKAILRASNYGNLRIMYPMITSLTEVNRANEMLASAKEELKEKGIPFNEKIKVGIMIETPAAAVTADKLAEVVDFFSIGTNDLTQYTLAVDRGNEKIAHLFQPLHPAVLQLIKQIIDASHKAGKWTGMCGELAGDESAAIVLLGMGLDEFSMSPVSLPKIKQIIRKFSFEDAQNIAKKVLDFKTNEEIVEYMGKVKAQYV